MSEERTSSKVVGVVTCDLECAPIGMASRLAKELGGVAVLRRTMRSLRQVRGVDEIVFLAPAGQEERVATLTGEGARVMTLTRRAEKLDAQIRKGRAWNLPGWRGGAGQWTVFDEDYHPAAIGEIIKATNAGHVLCVAAHAAFLDAGLTSALVHHHLHKNHEMRLTYTPAAPGLCGILLRADMALEMGEKGVLPGQLLGYDPKSPTFDTLIREACMQVDPALSKIPNRFLVDTDRDWAVAEKLVGREFESVAALALVSAELRGQGLGFGVRGDGVFGSPRELEIELTGKRMTHGPGSVPAAIREGRGELDAEHWVNWFGRQKFADDLLVTVCGDGDPILYTDLPKVLAGLRAAGVKNIHLQTDLCGDVSGLVEAIRAGNVDVLSVQFYGDDAATYATVAGEDLHGAVMKNMGVLIGVIERGGLPLVVPRLLKVRETIPQMEAFFDRWVVNASWAVIDGPTDRAGAVEFRGVVDMAPPKRWACRRIAERMVIRANGVAGACDQDVREILALGHIEKHTLAEMWRGTAMSALKKVQAGGKWAEMSPCDKCREWHRA